MLSADAAKLQAIYDASLWLCSIHGIVSGGQVALGTPLGGYPQFCRKCHDDGEWTVLKPIPEVHR